MPKFRFPGPLGIPKLGFRGLEVQGFRVWGSLIVWGRRAWILRVWGLGALDFRVPKV